MKNRKPIALTALASAAALSFAVHSALADNTVSYSGGTYAQDFNSLTTLGNTPPQTFGSLTIAPITIGPSPVGSAPVDLTAGSVDGVSIGQISTMTGWYATSFGGNSLPLTYNVDDGTDSKGVGVMAYFDPAAQPVGSNNMALGALTASASGNVEFGVKLINTGSTTLNAITLSYTGQMFHQDNNQQSLVFGYLVDPSGSSPIPNAGLTNFTALNVGSFATGTSAAVPTSASSTENLGVVNLPLSKSWAPGAALWLTWQMSSGGGGQGLAIDNLSFSAAQIAGAPALSWNTGNGTWDTTTGNWANSTNSGLTFSNGTNNVTFGNIASNTTITVQAGNVTLPNAAVADITNNNPNTAYTFTGGSIGGTGASLSIDGNGTVVLQAANTYGLATNLNAGKLVADNNNELGAAGAVLTFNGGTLQLANNLNAGTRPVSVIARGGTINTNGFNVTFGNTTASSPIIQGTLELSGGGNVTLGVKPTFGTNAAPAGHLVIDAGTTAILTGNGRSSATDMYDGGVFNGNLVLNTTSAGARFNFDSPGLVGNTDLNGTSKFTGTGEIQVVNGSQWTNAGNSTVSNWQLNTNGIVISNTSATYAAEIDVNLHLNSTNLPFDPLNVSTADFISNNNPNPGNSFVTVIGGTKINTQGHGPQFSNLIFKGVIYGNSDINIGNDYKNGGSGDMTWYAHNTYAGATIISGGGGLYTAIDDALPPTTNIIFGAIPGTVGGLVDLDGHSQHIQSVEIAIATNSPQANIIENSGDSNATLFITGNNTPIYPYNAQLNDGGTTTAGTTGSHTLALAKTGASTFVLGEYLFAGHSTTSTYSGGTTVSGGTLAIGFDGALGAPTGPLTLDGGTLSVQNPFFIGSPDATEITTSLTSDRSLTVTANGGALATPTFQATLQSSNATVSLVEPVTLSGNGGYNWGGKLQYTGAAGSSLTINGGTGNVTLSGLPVVQANAGSTIFVGGSSDPFTSTANPAAHVAIVSNGLVDFTAGSKAVAAISGNGTLQVDAGAALTSDGAKISTLLVNGTHVIRANATAAGTSAVSNLTLAGTTDHWTGHLDLSGNKLILETASKATAIATLRNQIAFGATNAAGITSSGLAANFAIAVMDNAVLSKTTFGGATVDGNSVLVGAELIGDSNADGSVDLTDLSTVLNNFGSTTSAWTSGNFDGATTIDLTDLSDVLNNFGATNPNASFAAPAVTATPEPTSLAMVGLGAAALLRRRKQA